MSNIKFKRIIVDAFLSFDHEELDVERSGITSIKGINNSDTRSESNGSGKSGLIAESLLWCLTGQTSRGTTAVTNMYLDRGGCVTVELQKDENFYKITRGTHKSLVGNGLFIYKDNVDMTGARIADTKEYLEKELPELSWSVLTSIVILSQGLVGGLSTLANKDRKARLEELAGVDSIYQNIKSLVTNVVSRCTAEAQVLANKRFELQTQINTNTNMINSLLGTIARIEQSNNAVRATDEIDSQILALQAEVQTLEKHTVTTEAELATLGTEYATLIDQKGSMQQLVMASRSEETILNSKINQLQADELQKAIDLKTVQHQLSHIEGKECPTCHQQIDKDITAELRQTAESKLAQLTSDIQVITANLAQLEATRGPLARVLGSQMADLRAITEKVDVINSRKSTLMSTLTTWRADIQQKNAKIILLYEQKNTKAESTESYKEKIANLSIENAALNAQLIGHERSEAIAASRLKTAEWFEYNSRTALRSYMLEGVTDYLNMRCEEYSEFLFNEDKVSIKLDGSSLDLYLGEKPIENISGGERRRLDIILQLAIRDLVMSQVGFNSNLLVIDEVFDHLDSVGMTSVLDLVTSQRGMIDTIYLITHKSDADLSYDYLMTVEKGMDNISRVVT